jgi:hypothetical protein
MHVIVTAASCSPAVVSRRAKNDGDFRAQKNSPHKIFPMAI